MHTNSYKTNIGNPIKIWLKTSGGVKIDAINKIVESIDVEDKKKITIVEEDKIIDIGDEADDEADDEEDDIEKNVCDKCNHGVDEVDEEIKESKNLEKECKEFLDGIDDNKDTKDNEDEI